MRVSNRHIQVRARALGQLLPGYGGLVLLGSMWAVSAVTQAQEVLIDAAPCMKFETSVERLVCFEQQAQAAGSTPAAPQGELPVLRIDRSQQLPPARSAAAPTPAPAAAAAQSGSAVPAASSTVGTTAAQPQDPQASFGLPQRAEREEGHTEDVLNHRCRSR